MERPERWGKFTGKTRCFACGSAILSAVEYDNHFTPTRRCARKRGYMTISQELLALSTAQPSEKASVAASVVWQGKTYQRGICKWCKREKQVLSEEMQAKIGQATVLAMPAGVCRLCVASLGTTLDAIASKLTAVHAGGTPK